LVRSTNLTTSNFCIYNYPMILNNKNILLAVTGSISAYKACDLVQRLKEQGAIVKVIMTPSAAKIITPLTFTALTGSKVHIKTFDDDSDTAMEHIELARWADIYLIAPCTANTLGEIANGMTQSLVSTIYLAYEKKVYIAPAMNTSMLGAAAVRRNLNQLREKGDFVLPSGSGMLACGEVGEGKLLNIENIVEYIKAGESLTSSYPKLQGKKCLIALGHTQEKIDDIRYISNRSSGKTGLAIARSLRLTGADVHLVCGKLDIGLPFDFNGGSQLTEVNSTKEFYQVITSLQPDFDILIMAAAMSDFVPVSSIEGKLTDSKMLKNIELKESQNILATVSKHKKENQVIVAFALENQGQESRGLEKWQKNNGDILFLNTPLAADDDAGFGSDNVRGIVLGKVHKELPTNLPLVSKFSLADNLLTELSEITG